VSHPRITAFAGSASGNAVPTRIISGQATLQARTNHGMAVDAIHDEIVVPNTFALAILFFRGNAKGDEAPIRVIQGPQTQLDYTDHVAVDGVNGEVYAAEPRNNAILVFNREPGGDVAPIRIIQGPKTKLDAPMGISVDTVNNLVAVSGQSGTLVFNRTDNGDVAPKWSFPGSQDIHAKSGTKTPYLYPEGRKIFVAGHPLKGAAGAVVGVWNYGDNGDVAPWAIIKASPTTKLINSNAAMDVNPEAKDVMVIGGAEVSGSERILIYHVPELFQ
jgi:hypothetical protein